MKDSLEFAFSVVRGNTRRRLCVVEYNVFDFFLENEENIPLDGCKIKI